MWEKEKPTFRSSRFELEKSGRQKVVLRRDGWTGYIIWRFATALWRLWSHDNLPCGKHDNSAGAEHDNAFRRIMAGVARIKKRIVLLYIQSFSRLRRQLPLHRGARFLAFRVIVN